MKIKIKSTSAIYNCPSNPEIDNPISEIEENLHELEIETDGDIIIETKNEEVYETLYATTEN